MAEYNIIKVSEGWGIRHEGQVSGSYLTKEAALEAAVLPASNAIKEGHSVTITVEDAAQGRSALGKE